jgi:hypothetical protein
MATVAARKADARHAFSIPVAGGLTIWFTVLFAVRASVSARGMVPRRRGDRSRRAGRARLVGKAIGTTLILGVVFAALVAFADYAG